MLSWGLLKPLTNFISVTVLIIFIMAFAIKPVLAYVKAFCQHADRLEVRGAVLNSYDSVAIRKVKDVLLAECCAKLDELKLEKRFAVVILPTVPRPKLTWMTSWMRWRSSMVDKRCRTSTAKPMICYICHLLFQLVRCLLRC